MKKLQKLIDLALALVSIVTVFAFPTSAASSSRVSDQVEDCLPIVTYASPLSGAKKVYAYNNSSLSKKQTSYYIDTYSDQIVITDISSNGKAVYVTYPTSSGKYRSKWFKTDDILGIQSIDISTYSAKQKLTVYRMSSSSKVKSNGSISKGDDCINLGKHIVNGKNYYVTIYPISKTKINGITVRHKIALATIAGYSDPYFEDTKIIDPSASKNSSAASSREEEIAEQLKGMMNGSLYDGVYEVGTKYKGPYYTEQCKGFAKSVFQKLFGYNIGSTQSRSAGNNYKLDYNSSKTKYVGSVTDITDDSTKDLKNLFEDARPGDFVQMRRHHSGSHSAIVVSVSSSKIVLLEANVDGKNGIIKKSYTWADLCDDNEAMSLYAAKNY